MNSNNSYEQNKLSDNSNLSGNTKNANSIGFNASNYTSNSADHSNSNLYLIKGNASSSNNQSTNYNQTNMTEEEPESYYFVMDQSYLEQTDDQQQYVHKRTNSLKKKKDLKPKKLDHFIITEESENTKTADYKTNSQNASNMVTPKLMKEGIKFPKDLNNKNETKNEKFVDQKVA